LKFEPFALERWLAKPRYDCDINLSTSVIKQFRYNELLSEIPEIPIRIGPTNGYESLREVVSTLYSTVDKNEILITHGAAEANFLLLNYLVDPGDECILLVPNYMQFFGILRGIGAKVNLTYLDSTEGYKPNIEEIKLLTSKKTKVIILTNPNNPTGAKLTEDELKAICDIAEENDAYVIGDEVLSGLEFEGRKSPSVVDIYEKGVSTRSVSKLGLSGLRVGWIAAHDKNIIKGCWAIKDYTSLGSSSITQYIAEIALNRVDIIIKRDQEILRNNVKILMEWVENNKNLISCTSPKAGSTALIQFKFNIDSVEFCRKLIKEQKVVVSPGDYFGAPRSFRILFGTDENILREGLERIGIFLKKLKK
jgi:aspartate/methionine/tyrosine aminotransferase